MLRDNIKLHKLVLSSVKSPPRLTAYNKDPASILNHKKTEDKLMDHIRDLGGIPAGVDESLVRIRCKMIR
jgi:hypothetical protein